MNIIEEDLLEFEKLLAESVRNLGHLPFKMSLRDLHEIGIQDPKQTAKTSSWSWKCTVTCSTRCNP